MADVPKKNRSGISATKAGGYAAQKRYRQNHPDRVREQNEPKLRIPIENKVTLEKLLSDTGLSITQLCLGAVEEKYGVTLLKPIDTPPSS